MVYPSWLLSGEYKRNREERRTRLYCRVLAQYINTRYLHYIAGIWFIGNGIFTLYSA